MLRYQGVVEFSRRNGTFPISLSLNKWFVECVIIRFEKEKSYEN